MKTLGIVTAIVLVAVLIVGPMLIAISEMMNYTTMRVMEIIKDQKDASHVKFLYKEKDEWFFPIRDNVFFVVEIDGRRAYSECFVKYLEPLFCDEASYVDGKE